MLRAWILGLGSYVPDRVVWNDEIAFLNERHERCVEQQTEVDDEWIRTRTGIEARRYVPADGSVACSDLGVEASRRALADAGIEPNEIDCIIFATLSPDIHFPGNGVFLQQKLGIANRDGCACFDIRQQCSGFLYGKKVLLNSIRQMVRGVQQALMDTGLSWEDIDWFVPHQANLRVNEAVVQHAGIPPRKVLNTLQMYGNTTAATVPLTIDHWRREGKVKRGDRILASVFGSGYTWGTAVFQL